MGMDNEELDERKVKILDAIIRNYLATGEPVGSRTISKYTDLNLSSATIRNEMSDLEELGYIVQPHTSAGRIPSDKGYRFYVDHLMQQKELSEEEQGSGSQGDEGLRYREDREDGSGIKAGGKDACKQYQLCNSRIGAGIQYK